MRGVLANLGSLARRHMLGTRAYPAFLILSATSSGSTPIAAARRPRHAHHVRRLRADLAVLSRERLAAAAAGELRPAQRAAQAAQAGRGAAGEVRRRHARHCRQAPRLAGVRVLLPWGGGAPGWISGMATATGMQAFGNLASATATPGTRTPRADDRRVQVAAAVGRDRAGPGRAELPAVLAVAQRAGRQRLRPGADRARQLPRGDGRPRGGGAGRLRARRGRRGCCRCTTPAPGRCTTAAPTSPGVESDLSYHQLFEGFLENLCTKFGEPFCSEADNFARYEKEPVAISSVATKVQRKLKRITASFVLSKRGSIRATLERDGTAVHAWSGGMLRGRHTLIWRLPRRAPTSSS